MRDKKGRFIKGHLFGKRIQKGQHLSPSTEFKKTKGKPNCKDCGKQLIEYDAIYCKSHVKRGERSSFWRGGVSSENKKLRNTIEYRLWRIAVFTRDNYTCQRCGQVGGHLEADHIKPFALFPELRLAIDNGRTLCIPCHRQTPTYGNKSMFAKEN